ncbi:MAG: hypothetical protein JXX28_01720 [Deltaproteobacteria bacterium]|nr:hypothetical protein [Deltaproteobacteria bacterium]
MTIELTGVRTHNLKGVDLRLPLGQLLAVTGVSGSGKSSLALDTLYAEAWRRYLELLGPHSRRYLERVERPRLERSRGLRPALAVDQAGVVRSARSTVGTFSGLLEPLRVLLARAGARRCHHCGADAPLDAAPCPQCGAPLPLVEPRLLSFNNAAGACPDCRGLGARDEVDPELLIADPSRTLRQGALIPTTPTGYIVYSQVTVDALDTVCQAHGFSVDEPWAALSEGQRRVVMFGSDRVQVPFGKHPLESRLQWSGITAKPRELGTYRGLVPVIQEILDRSPNPNARRFARTAPCPTCGGSRLSPPARALTVAGVGMAHLAALPLRALAGWLRSLDATGPVATVQEELLPHLAVLEGLGLGHLRLDRPSETLSGGEARRLRLASQVRAGLTGTLLVLDEPSAGLHPADQGRLLALLRGALAQGVTPVVVEHEPALIQAADWLVDVGPGAGREGGEVLWCGAPAQIGEAPARSATRASLTGGLPPIPHPLREGSGWLELEGASLHNLRGDLVRLRLGALNAISGVSGAGKTTLGVHTLAACLRAQRAGERPCEHLGALRGAEALRGVEVVDDAPLGRTPRSNPATYVKLFDALRRELAATELAAARGYGPGHFSFNKDSGRCPTCEGAGVITVGMHVLADAVSDCPACGGSRYLPEVLEVRWMGLSAAELLALTVDEALSALATASERVIRPLEALAAVGLGYLTLGQPSPTLSGGEARRVRLAAHLARPPKGPTLFVLDEPTTGLHPADVRTLLLALRELVAQGHTVVALEHDRDVLLAVDHLVDLGPGAADQGGRVVVQGTPAAVRDHQGSATGASLRAPALPAPLARPAASAPGHIALRGARTHNLRGLDLDLPHRRLTVITGPSGSGKSSLAVDTLLAESWRRYTRALSPYARRFAAKLPAPALDEATGLLPAVGVGQAPPGDHPGSTVATATGLAEVLRLLWSRAGTPSGLPASAFSPLHPAGACPACGGRGTGWRLDPERLIAAPSRGLCDGALADSLFGRHHGDPHGQTAATLRAVGAGLGLDLLAPWEQLSQAGRDAVLAGTGDRPWEIRWDYRRGQREGTHHLTGPWAGLSALAEEERAVHEGKARADKVRALMSEQPCASCGGSGLREAPRRVVLGGWTLPELLALPAARAREVLAGLPRDAVSDEALELARSHLDALLGLRLGHLALARPLRTLSGGEARRVQLTAALRAPLTGLCLVLDEPTRGLHPADTAHLLTALRALLDAGQTLVAVEHDEALIRAADHLIELGPAGGPAGGALLGEGAPAELLRRDDSPTARALATPCPTAPPRQEAGAIEILGARAHTLRRLDLRLPRGALTALTGVSGSGKSSLLLHTLRASADAGRPVQCDAIRGLDAFVEVVTVAGSAPRTSPASALGLLDPLRARFAATAEARAGGLGRAAFSPHSPQGRCPTCGGAGEERVALGFLADATAPCPDCGGTGLRPEPLGVRWRGHTLPALLALPAEALLALVDDLSTLATPLRALVRVGLGYLPLGRRGATLSGGEARRLLLAKGLAERRGPTLLLLDEPTAGLPRAEVLRLIHLLHDRVLLGDTVIAVTHHLDLMRASHHLVDLGPGAGEEGGAVVIAGTPAEVAARGGSLTGAALRQ